MPWTRFVYSIYSGLPPGRRVARSRPGDRRASTSSACSAWPSPAASEAACCATSCWPRARPSRSTDALYLPTVITAAIVVSVIAGEPGPRVLRAVSILDALAVGFFAVASALRAKQAGVTVPAQLLIGVIGGSGGALLRDVLTARTPEIFRHGELNAIAAFVAAGIFLAADTQLQHHDRDGDRPARRLRTPRRGDPLQPARTRPQNLTPGRPVALHQACTKHSFPARSARSTSRPTTTA